MTKERSVPLTHSPAATLASVHDIRKRLLRPSSDCIMSSPGSKLVVEGRNSCFKSKEDQAKKEKKKLEDYLDPVLLSAISAKIDLMKNIAADEVTTNKTKKQKSINHEFDWPAEELKAFMAESIIKRRVQQGAVAVPGDDLSKFIEGGDHERCTPFKRFEKTTVKRFNA